MRKIYIDCGSNKGKVTRKFILDGHKDYEYFLFEPLPLFHISYNIGEMLSSEFPEVSINYSDKAVWIDDTEMEFYVCGRGNEGSSLLENKYSNRMDHEHPVKVQGFDFSKWIMDNFSPNDHIIIKMDIEGAEYDVLPKMIEDGSIEYANEMLIEFHGRKQLRGDYIHDKYKEIQDYFNESEVKLTEWW